MTAEEIKSKLDQKNITQADLARRFKTSKTAIHFLIHGQLKSKDLERKLARALGVKLEDLRNETRAA